MQGGEDPLVPLAEQRGQDVLAHLFPPEAIRAVAARQIAGVEIYPVSVRSAVDPESAGPRSGGAKLEAPFQPVEIDPDGFNVKWKLGHDVPHGRVIYPKYNPKMG
jgi:hypothetical protein